MSELTPGTVLIVEDDEAVREAVAEVMSEQGFHAVGVIHGQEAIELLHSSRTLPCLIVLDLMMPVMDGWQFCAWLEAQPSPLRDIPVVLLSASPRLLHGATGLNVRERLEKPISLERLIGTVQRFCPPVAGRNGDDDLLAA